MVGFRSLVCIQSLKRAGSGAASRFSDSFTPVDLIRGSSERLLSVSFWSQGLGNCKARHRCWIATLFRLQRPFRNFGKAAFTRGEGYAYRKGGGRETANAFSSPKRDSGLTGFRASGFSLGFICLLQNGLLETLSSNQARDPRTCTGTLHPKALNLALNLFTSEP